MGELTLILGIAATYIKEQPTKYSYFIIAKLENIRYLYQNLTHLITCYNKHFIYKVHLFSSKRR